MALDRVQVVRELSDSIVSMLIEVSADSGADVAIIALVDAAVRLLRVASPRLSTARACRELARVVEKIGRAEGEG